MTTKENEAKQEGKNQAAKPDAELATVKKVSFISPQHIYLGPSLTLNELNESSA